MLRINPEGQVPVLVHGNVEIFDSTQIFEYPADLCRTPPLWPHNIEDLARTRLLENQSTAASFPSVVRLMRLQNNLGDALGVSRIMPAAAYYLISDEGSANVGLVSLCTANRLRTLSLENLSWLDVPVPGMAVQKIHERLQAEVAALNRKRAASRSTNAARLSAMLERAALETV
jgi:glutathione S-transferase